MASKKELNFYRNAPDVEVLDLEGNPALLSSFWKEKPLLLAFTRHFGCTQCKEMLDELVQGRERIEEAGLAVAVINQGTPAATSLFAKEFAPGLVLLCSPQRKA